MSLQYIIDGYNIINHPLFTRTHKGPRKPQGDLLSFLKIKRLTGSSKNKVIVVFDGYPVAGQVSNVDADIGVIFSRKISADDKIKRLVEESANRKNIVVVSDDNEIKFMVKSLGARSMGIEEFIRSKDKTKMHKNKEIFTYELTYSQMHKINQELRQIWLKP